MSDFDLSVLQAELAKLQNVSQLAENLSAVQEHSKHQLNEIRELRRVLLNLTRWGKGVNCNDCTPERTKASNNTFQHERDCGYLESLNEALELLGRPKQ